MPIKLKDNNSAHKITTSKIRLRDPEEDLYEDDHEEPRYRYVERDNSYLVAKIVMAVIGAILLLFIAYYAGHESGYIDGKNSNRYSNSHYSY